MNKKSIANILPGKTLTLAQGAVGLLLVLIICFASFGAIFSVELEIDDEMKASIEDAVSAIDSDAKDIVIPEKIDVSLPFILKSAGATIDSLKTIMDGLSDTKKMADSVDKLEDIEDPEELEKEAAKLEKDAEDLKNKAGEIVNQDVVNFLAFFIAIFMSFKAGFIVGVCNFLMLGMVFVFPIACLIRAICALIGFLVNFKKDQGKACHKVSKAIFGTINVFPMLLLMMVLVPEVKFGSAVTTTLIMCIIALVIGLAVSRLKYYEAPDFKYLNVLQAVSAASLVGFIVFFCNIVKTNLIGNIFAGMGAYAKKELTTAVNNAVKDSAEKESIDFLPLILIIVTIVALIIAVKFLSKIVTRLACISKNKSDIHIATTIIALVAIIAPVVLMNTDFKLEMSDDEMSAFIGAGVGIVIMLISEILMIALPKKLCADVSDDRRKEIVTGAYFFEEATEEAVAEEAVAEEAVAEEAPAEDAAEEKVEQ